MKKYIMVFWPECQKFMDALDEDGNPKEGVPEDAVIPITNKGECCVAYMVEEEYYKTVNGTNPYTKAGKPRRFRVEANVFCLYGVDVTATSMKEAYDKGLDEIKAGRGERLSDEDELFLDSEETYNAVIPYNDDGSKGDPVFPKRP
ncbi:MAG: hypothetical protein EOM65_04850 [Synergistales bacterium]|nr:hypothetical protein [Synergistales bacterium]